MPLAFHFAELVCYIAAHKRIMATHKRIMASGGPTPRPFLILTHGRGVIAPCPLFPLGDHCTHRLYIYTRTSVGGPGSPGGGEGLQEVVVRVRSGITEPPPDRDQKLFTAPPPPHLRYAWAAPRGSRPIHAPHQDMPSYPLIS